MLARNLHLNHEVILIGLLTALSSCFSVLLYRTLGAGAGLFSLLPIVVAAYLFHFRANVIVWTFNFAFNVFFFVLSGYSSQDIFIHYGGIPGIATHLVIGLGASLIQEIGKKLHDQRQQVSIIEQKLQQRNAEIEAVQQASLQITSRLELKPILETIIENVLHLVRADDIHIFLYDGGQLTFGAALWEDQKQKRPYQEPRLDGATYRVARTCEPLVIPDVNSHPLYQEWKWGGAIAVLPLSIQNQVYGVMNVAFLVAHTFDEAELRILRLLANQAAVAIQNAQLFEAVRRQTADLEQHVAERTTELVWAKERAEAVLNNSFDAIVLFSPLTGIEQTNPAFLSLFGYDADRVFRQPITSLVHSDAKGEFLNLMRKVVVTRQAAQTEITLQRQDGTKFVADVSLAPFLSQDTQFPKVIGSIRDISRRKRAEERQRDMAAGLRTVLAVAKELMSYPDVDTTLHYAVEATRNKLGLERCAIFIERDGFLQGTYGTDNQGQTTDEHALRFTIDEKWQQRFDRLKPEDAQWILVEDTHTEWDGEEIVSVGAGWIAITPIYSADGSRVFLINDTNITGKDVDEIQQDVAAVFCSLLAKIVERKRVEENISRALEQETELGELKSRFISTISHEFRTPLTVIQSSTQLLKYYSDRMDDEKKQFQLDKIEGQIKQAVLLLENVLTISRAETIGLVCQPSPVDLIGFCSTLVEEIELTVGATHRIIFGQSEARTVYQLDAQLLRQIVTNLLTNALKYSPPQSCVKLDIVCESNQVVICVKDSGIGIPAEDQPHLFQDFHRARNVGAVAGTGLGLSIVKRAAEAHGGTIAVTSEEGIGTTFTVKLAANKVSL
jgi:PAS domain S-box-containing protein